MVLALHPNERATFKRSLAPPFFFSTKLDLHTEYLMADAQYLVTDYSSLIFDWLLLSRPMGLFCPDLAPYRETRGFPYFDYEEAFGSLLHASVDDLAEDMDQALSGVGKREKLLNLKRRFHDHEAGRASERLFDVVLRQTRGRSRAGAESC